MRRKALSVAPYWRRDKGRKARNRKGRGRVVQLNFTPEIEAFHMLFERSFHLSNSIHNTEIRYKAGPRLRDLASWAPSGRRGEFTQQPRAHLIAELCT